MGWTLCIPELLAKRVERGGILVVTVDIAQQANQFFESDRIEAAVFFQAVLRTGAKLIKIPAGFGNADNGNVEMSPFHHRLKGGEDLFVRKIACSPEKHKRVRGGIFHERHLLQAGSGVFAGFSKCPPNW